jgi:hypothetical protein
MQEFDLYAHMRLRMAPTQRYKIEGLVWSTCPLT